MNTPTHAAVNLIASVPLRHLFGWDWTLIYIFILAGVFIDIDHILFFIFKEKKLNPRDWILIGKKMRSKMRPGLYVSHSPEFNTLLLVVSFFNEIAFVIFISNLIHISLDTIEHYRYHKNFLWIKKWSIIYSLRAYSIFNR